MQAPDARKFKAAVNELCKAPPCPGKVTNTAPRFHPGPDPALDEGDGAQAPGHQGTTETWAETRAETPTALTS